MAANTRAPAHGVVVMIGLLSGPCIKAAVVIGAVAALRWAMQSSTYVIRAGFPLWKPVKY